MATARKFALGAVVAAKSNRAKGISAGQFLVVQKTLDPNKAADLLLLPSKEDADAVSAHIKAGTRGGPTKDAHDAAMAKAIAAPALLDYDIRWLQDVSTAWRGMAPPCVVVGYFHCTHQCWGNVCVRWGSRYAGLPIPACRTAEAINSAIA